MVFLHKVTCAYSEAEDRLCMSAITKGGERIVFWLTLRFCCRLIRALTDHLERSVSRSALVETGLSLSCQQRDAEWQHEPSEPVSYNEGAIRVLPEKVALSCSTEGVLLVFPLRAGEDAQLPLSLQELRQWLAIVYRQFKKASWPMDVWPDWFTWTESGKN